MFEPHLSQFVVRAETMNRADQGVADERAGALARALWLLVRGLVGRANTAASSAGCPCDQAASAGPAWPSR